MNKARNVTDTDVAQPKAMTPVEKIFVVLFFVLMFLTMTVTNGRMSMIMVWLGLGLTVLYVLAAGKRSLSELRQNLNIPAAGFLGFALMYGLAAIYSPFDSYATAEFYRFIPAFVLTAILLFCFRKSQTEGVVWGLSSVSTIIGFLGVDAACHGPVFGAFQSLMHSFGVDYSYVNEEAIPRLNGIYNDSNITASILALGCLLGLYLLLREQRLWRRLVAAELLGVSAVSFFMSISRGAMGCLALALLVWLVAERKGSWIRLLLLMAAAMGLAAGLSAPAMSLIHKGSLIPDACALLCGPAIFLVDWLVGVPLARLLEKKLKLAVAVAAVLVLGGAAFMAAAITVSAPYMLEQGQYVIRSVKLAPGQYTVSGDWDGAPTAVVYANSEKDVLLQKNTEVYRGPLAEAAFTIPEDTKVIQVQIEMVEGNSQLREVAFSDGTRLHLGYPLLPDFISGRLQDGMFSSYNFTQRVQYYKDAMTLWKQAPIFGHGLASTEGLYTSVQPYFYQSRYVHNHVLQALCDMGLVGGLFFLTALVGVGWVLLRRLWRQQDTLAAVLLACWVMINVHSLMEINFSIRGYQCFVYPLLIFSAARYAAPIPSKLARQAGRIGALCIWLYLAVFGALLQSHRMVQEELNHLSSPDAATFMKKLESCIRRDVFERDQMKLNYVANAVVMNDPAYAKNLVKYTNDLREMGTYMVCSSLSKQLYLPMGAMDELFDCSRQGIAQEASVKDAWNFQLDFYRTEVTRILNEENYDRFLAGVLGTKEYLEQYSAQHWEEIQLTEPNQKFLTLIQSLKDQGLSAKEGLIRLMAELPKLETEEVQS